MSSRTKLKSYFLSGATPTEANFADLIDSVVVIEEDLVDGFTSTSTTDALSANAGKTLNDSLVSLTSRVVTLEGASTDYLSSYYTKSEIDSSLTSIGTTIDSKASVSSLNELSSTVSGIQTSLEGKANTSHAHAISDVTSLQSTLDEKATKAYVDSTKAFLNNLINGMGSGGSSYDDTAITNRVTTLESNASSYATASQLATKANTVHGHTVADISDLNLNEYYNKSSIDALFAKVEPGEHTHTESEITDLDKYTKAATDLIFSDHANRKDNPHGITKEQVSLGNVENLSVVSLFQTPQAQLLATRAEVTEVATHATDTSNPHEVNKVQVSLGNVPNIDVNALLTAHLAAENPHNITLPYEDFYTKAETQQKIEDNYDAHRYYFTPSGPTDGSGAVGDITYDGYATYMKVFPNDWRQIVLSKTHNDGTGTTEIDTANFVITGGETSNLFEINNDGTSSKVEIKTASVSIGGSLKTADVSIGGSLTIGSSLQFTGGTLSFNESTNKASVFNEEIATETDVASLQAAIDAEASTRASDDTTLQSNIDSEASSRASADTTLQSNIDTEASTRASADSTLQANIDAEETARQTADSTLQGNIDAESSTRASADSTIQSNVSNLTTRVATLEGQVTTMQGQITTLQNKVSTLESAKSDFETRISALESA